MKREAVQEERQRTKDRDTSEVESTSNMQVEMPLERIVEAEKRVECNEVSASLEVNTDSDFYLITIYHCTKLSTFILSIKAADKQRKKQNIFRAKILSVRPIM